MQARALARWLGENKQTSLRVAVLMLSAVGILALATAIEMFKVGERTAGYQVALEKSIEQRAHIRRAAAGVLDAESSQRDYLLTGRNDHMERFDAAQSTLRRTLESLGVLQRERDLDTSGSWGGGVALAAAGDAPSPDEEALAEIRNLMGDAWVRANLTRLKARVKLALAVSSGDAPDRRRIRQVAHQIVPDAGQLGFRDLSRACREFEAACADVDGDLAPTLCQV